jgi:hypothetical protein
MYIPSNFAERSILAERPTLKGNNSYVIKPNSVSCQHITIYLHVTLTSINSACIDTLHN